jgi:hypothetical protein
LMAVVSVNLLVVKAWATGDGGITIDPGNGLLDFQPV